MELVSWLEYPLAVAQYWSPTNSIELSRWKAASLSVTEEFRRMLRNQKVRYRVHKSLPLSPILIQMKPIQLRKKTPWSESATELLVYRATAACWRS
jgi:hypothetical protein